MGDEGGEREGRGEECEEGVEEGSTCPTCSGTNRRKFKKIKQNIFE